MTPDYSKDIDKLKGKTTTQPTPQQQPIVKPNINKVPAEGAFRPVPASLQNKKVETKIPTTAANIGTQTTMPSVTPQQTPDINVSKEIPVSGSTSNIVDLNKSMVSDLYNVGKTAFKNLVTYANNIQGAGRQILGEKLKNIQEYETQALGHLDNMKKYLTEAENNAMNKVNLSAATQKIQGLSDAKKMFAGNTGQDAAFIEQQQAETDAKIADTKLKYTEGLINLEGQYKALKGEILDRTDINDNQKLQLVESLNQRLSDIEGQKMQFSSNLINQQYSVPMQLSQMLLQYAMAKKSSGGSSSGIVDFLRKSGIEGADKIADNIEGLPKEQQIAYDNVTPEKATSILEKLKQVGTAYAKGSAASGNSPLSINAGGVASAVSAL